MRVFADDIIAARYYLARLRACEADFSSRNLSSVPLLAALECDWLQVAHSQRWSASQMTSGNDAAVICAEFALAAPVVFEVWLGPRDRLRWALDGLRAARLIRDKAREVRIMGRVGLALSDRGKHGWAGRTFEAQRELAAAVDDKKSLGDAIGNIGIALKRRQQYRRAAKCYIEQFRMCGRTGDATGQGHALGNLAVALRYLKHLGLARAALLRRMQLAKEINDERGLANACLNLGLVSRDLGEQRTALRWFQEARSRFHGSGDVRGVARCLASIGQVHTLIGKVSEAAQYMKRALLIFRKHGFADDAKQAEELLSQLNRRTESPG